MGYDVTYHPITREEMLEWYFEPLRDDAAIDRLAEKHGFLAENYRHYIRSAKRHIEDATQDASFESVHGLMIAVGQGLMRRYDYFRGCLFTRLVEDDPRFKKYVQSFSTFVPEEYQSMRFADGIEENWCGGVYIPPEAVGSLIHDIENDPAIRSAVLKNFGNEEELNRFLNLLRYAEGNKLGVLEATEVVFPFVGNCMSDFGNCEPGFMDRITVSPFLTTPHCYDDQVFSLGEDKYYVDEQGNLQEKEPLEVAAPFFSQKELAEKRALRKWQMRNCVIAFVVFTLLEFSALVGGLMVNRHERFIIENGVVAEGNIVQHYLRPRNHYRIEYSFEADGEEYKRKASLQKDVWNKLEGRETVSIRYLPNKPKKSRVAEGDKDTTSGNSWFWIGCIGTPLFLICFIITFLGYDIDSYGGVNYLLKPGQIVEDRIAELAEKKR